MRFGIVSDVQLLNADEQSFKFEVHTDEMEWHWSNKLLIRPGTQEDVDRLELNPREFNCTPSDFIFVAQHAVRDLDGLDRFPDYSEFLPNPRDSHCYVDVWFHQNLD